ncbi:MAG TPA: hypothetical protein PLC89_18680 [Haliscomenobacter sp.]|uniref:hypothetical protein n=1 Tax=Haliscomenobacter sp. TaxID=2717303 RepID=UPI001DF887A8|nr:hypothetical protein [Haliscomenobacter sp.]MBK9491604.1 hypothetical protein [Haliscomenobacter sp.]HOY19342.1 hypothetical protein [Haliscomenobacter sp.]HPH19508.1 hypothetical protein [Haliscomenobacter sp.]
MKLTPFAKILILAVVAVGIFLGVRKFLPQSNTTVTTDKETTSPARPVEEEEKPSTKSKTTTTRSSFSYLPPAPVNGKLKGVVELGASGFNSFIVNIDAKKTWKLEKAEFGSSLVYENMATDDDVRAGLKNYISNMLNYGVSGKDIHFVVSSGAIKTPETQKIAKGLKALGYFVNPVTAEQEGAYALKCVLPASYAGEAFVLDIGSGNTKVSWMEGGTIKSGETYGSKYFQNNVTDAAAYEEASSIAAQIPASKRKICFIIGGIPFEFAKQLRNGKERFTVLSKPADLKAEGGKQKSGLNIYKAFADETGCKTFVFDWDANFTIGFLLDLK